MFPAISAQSRPPSEDLRASGNVEVHAAASKQNQIRRQQPIEQQRRSPLRSNSLIASTATRYLSAAAAAVAATAQTPSDSVAPLVRSPSFVQTGTSAQFEPAKSELVSKKTNLNHPSVFCSTSFFVLFNFL